MACLAALAACGSAPAPTARPVGEAAASEPQGRDPLRLLVKLVQPSTDPDAVARLVATTAGVPARHVSASSAQWHAVLLRCEGKAQCDDAVRRLRAERSAFEAVELDAKMRAF